MKQAAATAESNMKATLQQHDTKVCTLQQQHDTKVAQMKHDAAR
jgi:hypothetical protein